MIKSTVDSWVFFRGRTHLGAGRTGLYLRGRSWERTPSSGSLPSRCLDSRSRSLPSRRLDSGSRSLPAGLKAGLIAAIAILMGFLFAFAGPRDSTANTAVDTPGDTAVPFPKGYHRWVHVKSTIVTAQHAVFAKRPCEKPCVGGIYHFYANEKAMEGYRTGRFPDGAILADDIHEIREGPSGGNFTPEGPLRGVGVMVKDSQRYSATGGWGYESFNPGNESVGALSAAEKTDCYACHVSRKDHDFVFTSLTE